MRQAIATDALEFLPPEALQSLAHLSVRAKTIVLGALSGLHRARGHGASAEFAQHQQYSPGDELRRLDWRVYARSDRYYIKRFEHEAQLTAHLFLDASDSMSYGRAPLRKVDYGTTLAAALAYLLGRQRDRVAFHHFGRELTTLPAAIQPLAKICEWLAARESGGPWTAADAVGSFLETRPARRTLCVFFSDLLEQTNESLQALHQLQLLGHEVVIFHLLHPDELQFPFDAPTRFIGLEDQREVVADADAVRDEYRRRLTLFLDHVESTCRQHAVTYHLSRCDRPFEQVLLDFLGERVPRPLRR